MRTIDETEAQQAAPRHDTELTLGSGALLLMFFGLVLLCGLCFGVGYSMGHRGIQDGSEAANFAAGASAFFHGRSSPAKPTTGTSTAPAPIQEPVVQPAPQSNLSPVPTEASPRAAVALPESSARPAIAPPVEPASPPPAIARVPTPAPTPQPVVKPAMAKPVPLANLKADSPAKIKPASAANAKPPAAVPAKPAPPQGPVMVQIAAVSQDEDAEVLAGALRKRNYAVVSGRDPLDGLIHVRIGPFKTRDEADTWRDKLLNDGYNAIIQP